MKRASTIKWWQLAASASAVASIVACAPAADESAALSTTALTDLVDAGSEAICLEEEDAGPIDAYDAGTPPDEPPPAPPYDAGTSPDEPPAPPPVHDAGGPLIEAPPLPAPTDGGANIFPADRPRPPPPPPKCPPKPPPPPTCKAGATRSDASDCHWTRDYSKSPPPMLCAGRVRNEVCKADSRGRTSWELTSWGTCSSTQCSNGK